MIKRQDACNLLLVLSVLFLAGSLTAQGEIVGEEKFSRLWPEQKRPAGLVTVMAHPFAAAEGTNNVNGRAQAVAEDVLAQSLAGLTARAVNENRFDEIVYIEETRNQHYQLWRKMLLKRTGIEDRGNSTVWDLIASYKGRGVYDGYLLYGRDKSEGPLNTRRNGSDESINVATSMSGPLRGLLISEELEDKAKSAGLKCIEDVRGKTEEWVFERIRDQLNPRGVLVQDPRMPFGRGTAIAHGFFCVYGLEAPTENIYRWMSKPGLVFGWNDGHKELESIIQASEYGHVVSAADWEYNLAALSIGSSSYKPGKMHSDALASGSPIAGPAVAFCMSDGDNLQWMLRDLALNKNYWASPDHGAYVFNWGLPLADMLETGMDVYSYLQETCPEKSSVFLMPEYFYPDHFALKLPVGEREKLLRMLGRRYEDALKRTGVGVMGMLIGKLDSREAIAALELMASEMPSLKGMLVWPYHPYEGGDGRVFWLKRCGDDAGQKQVGEIPAIYCKYSLWAKRKDPRSGSPAKLAREINENAVSMGKDLNAFGLVHAWSGFYEKPGVDENAETGEFLAPGTWAGVSPALWCARRLNQGVSLITTDELVRRVTEQRNKKQ